MSRVDRPPTPSRPVRRRREARQQLRTALEMFTIMGAEGFADRSERELSATGERARKRRVETRDDLTPQEAQIARLARDGLSNAEIGARIFVSQTTVAYHLRNGADAPEAALRGDAIANNPGFVVDGGDALV